MLGEPLPKDVLGASTQRCCGSLYLKIWWEPLPKDVVGASTQRCGGSLYPKMLWEPLPKDVVDASWKMKLLERAHMVNCNPSRTPVDTESKLGLNGVLVQDPTMYRRLAGGLQYLTSTCLDLSYAVQQICLYMHDPREPHLADLKRILRYVQGGLSIYKQVYLSAEAEYRAVANVVAETAWLRNLLRELHSPLSTVTLVYCDNVSVVYMSANPIQHQRTKHIEIDIHFVCDMVTAGQVRVHHVPSRYQYAISSPKVFLQLCLKNFGPV
ncbi:ribonuclease H-like domain-containing protein [Tanacetum coccineum]